MRNFRLLERMGVSAKSYIAEPNSVSYDETDVGKRKTKERIKKEI